MALVRVLRQGAASGGLLFAAIPLPQLCLWPLSLVPSFPTLQEVAPAPSPRGS